MIARQLNDDSVAGRWVNCLAVPRSILHNEHAAQPMRTESYPFCTAKSMDFSAFRGMARDHRYPHGAGDGEEMVRTQLHHHVGSLLWCGSSILFGWVVDTAN